MYPLNEHKTWTKNLNSDELVLQMTISKHQEQH